MRTLSQIVDELRRRLNVDDEVTDSDLVTYLNRVKRDAQDGTPLGFMKHEAVILSGSGLFVPGIAGSPGQTFHVREAFLVPTGISQGDLESVILFDNVTTAFLSGSPVFTHNGAAASYTYHSGALTGGVTVTGSPAISWVTDHFEMPYVTFSKGGHDYNQLWVGGQQQPPPLTGALIFDALFPDPTFQHACVATDSPDVPPQWGNPVTLTDVDPTTMDFNLWLVEFDVNIPGEDPVAATLPGDWFKYLLLPPNFHTPHTVEVLTAKVFTAEEVSALFGEAASDLNAPVLWYFPSSCSNGDGGTMEHNGEAEGGDLYPLFSNDLNFIADELDARGISIDLEALELEANIIRPEVLGREPGSFVPIPAGEASRYMVAVHGDQSEYLSRDISEIVEQSGYADPPFTGEVLDLHDVFDQRPELTGPVLVRIRYWRMVPDYNDPNLELIGAPLVDREDVFTRTGEKLLTNGGLRWGHTYLMDDTRADYFRKMEEADRAEFRRRHFAKIAAGTVMDRRYKLGTRVRRWREGRR